VAQTKKKPTYGPDIPEITEALEPYKRLHPKSKIKSYRQNSASIRIRIIDPDFEGMDRVERHDLVWGILEALDEDILSEISVLLLLTPEEVKTSFANMDFDYPIPSGL
jgi:stress-induced morphogen